MYAIQTPRGFIATLNATRASTTSAREYVKTWKTAKAAASAIAKYADSGLGLNSATATVVPFQA